jgi:hypothetical protein
MYQGNSISKVLLSVPVDLLYTMTIEGERLGTWPNLVGLLRISRQEVMLPCATGLPTVPWRVGSSLPCF